MNTIQKIPLKYMKLCIGTMIYSTLIFQLNYYFLAKKSPVYSYPKQQASPLMHFLTVTGRHCKGV